MSHFLICPCVPSDLSDPESLTALAERYLSWSEVHNFAANTVAIRRRHLARFIDWCHERSVTRAREVTPAMLERYQRHLFYYRKEDGQPLRISSQSHWLTALRSWFRWLARHRFLAHNPAADLELPREEKRLPRHALSRTEVEAVLAQPDIDTPVGLRSRAVMETLYSTGLRRIEVLQLYLSDIDRQRGVLLVRQGKGNKDRFVPIGARALGWIDLYLAKARPQLTDDPREPLLFLTTKGRQVHPNELSAKVRQYMDQAGITKKGSCHLFRHSTATLMLEGGAGLRYIQALLGHVSLSTTQIYTHVSIPKLCEVHRRTHPAQLTGYLNDVGTPPAGPDAADGPSRDDAAPGSSASGCPLCGSSPPSADAAAPDGPLDPGRPADGLASPAPGDADRAAQDDASAAPSSSSPSRPPSDGSHVSVDAPDGRQGQRCPADGRAVHAPGDAASRPDNEASRDDDDDALFWTITV